MIFNLEKGLHGVFHAPLGISERVVLIYALLNWKDAQFEVTLEAWGAGAGASRATIKRALDNLIEGKFIKVVRPAGYQRVEDESGDRFSKHYPGTYRILIKNLK